MPPERERRRRWGPGSGRRPPWWPEGEPFPPQGRPGPEAWRAMRRRFIWRAALLLVLVIALLTLVGTFVANLAIALLGGEPLDAAATVVSAIVGVVLIGVIAFGLRRIVRGTAAPVGDLIEAAGRVEAGDFGFRVPERGPREVRSLAAAFNAMSTRLEATEEQRRRLLADVSHELRTPLTVIQGTLEGIVDGVYPADAEHLGPALEETRLLGRLVDDLRTLASAEAGSLSLHREPTEIGDVLTDVAAAFRPAADEARVTLDVRVADDIPSLEIDAERIRQVLANLVANALRYTDAYGRIELAAALDDTTVSVTVTDSGSGMDAEQLQQVFDRFYRSPESRGSGLGLPIARGLVLAHGGEISASSEPGRGTTIRFTLPREA
jgi:signal transduction histidine kinase